MDHPPYRSVAILRIVMSASGISQNLIADVAVVSHVPNARGRSTDRQSNVFRHLFFILRCPHLVQLFIWHVNCRRAVDSTHTRPPTHSTTHPSTRARARSHARTLNYDCADLLSPLTIADHRRSAHSTAVENHKLGGDARGFRPDAQPAIATSYLTWPGAAIEECKNDLAVQLNCC